MRRYLVKDIPRPIGKRGPADDWGWYTHHGWFCNEDHRGKLEGELRESEKHEKEEEEGGTQGGRRGVEENREKLMVNNKNK